MKAIRTRYLPATNTKGTRIVAETGGGNKVVVARSYGKEYEEDEREAVTQLLTKLNWPYTVDQLVSGGGVDNSETYWVFK